MPEVKFDFLPSDWEESYKKMDLERKGKVLELLKCYATGYPLFFKKDYDAEVVSVTLALIRLILNPGKK